MKKKIASLLLLLFVITGCTSIENKNIDELLELLLKQDNEKYNVVFDGYKYYVPFGIRFVSKDEYNATMMDERDNIYYFYSDVVSYYNNEVLTYKENKDAYYSKELDYNGKKGYLEITTTNIENYYFIEYMYNYGKLESVVLKDDIEDVIIQMSSILSSLEFNRTVLETLIGNKVLNYKEETYNVMEPKGDRSNAESYLDYEEKYGNYEGYTPKDSDEDEIQIEEEE